MNFHFKKAVTQLINVHNMKYVHKCTGFMLHVCTFHAVVNLTHWSFSFKKNGYSKENVY